VEYCYNKNLLIAALAVSIETAGFNCTKNGKGTVAANYFQLLLSSHWKQPIKFQEKKTAFGQNGYCGDVFHILRYNP